VILRSFPRVLSLLLSFRRSDFSHVPILCMDRERLSGCCVILRSRFIDVTSNFVPFCFVSDSDAHQHHLYLHTPPVSGSRLASAFSYYHYLVVMCSASSPLALAFIVCAYYFYCIWPLSCIFFIRPFSSFPLFIFPPDLIFCYLTCISSRHP